MLPPWLGYQNSLSSRSCVRMCVRVCAYVCETYSVDGEVLAGSGFTSTVPRHCENDERASNMSYAILIDTYIPTYITSDDGQLAIAKELRRGKVKLRE